MKHIAVIRALNASTRCLHILHPCLRLRSFTSRAGYVLHLLFALHYRLKAPFRPLEIFRPSLQDVE